MNKYLLLSLSILASAPLYSADFSVHSAVGRMECKVCFDAKNVADCLELSCGHAYCKECLNSIIQGAISDENNYRNLGSLTCPDPGCRKKIDLIDIQRISGKRAADIVSNLETLAFLDAAGGIKQCPTPNCASRFFNEEGSKEVITCSQCHAQYCANCLFLHPGHIRCEDYAADQQAKLDDASAKWLKEHTKQCPKCHTRVQKIEDGSCLMVHCGNKSCPKFCWHCGREHGDTWHCYLTPIQVKDSVDETLKKQQELERQRLENENKQRREEDQKREQQLAADLELARILDAVSEMEEKDAQRGEDDQKREQRLATDLELARMLQYEDGNQHLEEDLQLIPEVQEKKQQLMQERQKLAEYEQRLQQAQQDHAGVLELIKQEPPEDIRLYGGHLEQESQQRIDDLDHLIEACQIRIYHLRREVRDLYGITLM